MTLKFMFAFCVLPGTRLLSRHNVRRRMVMNVFRKSYERFFLTFESFCL